MAQRPGHGTGRPDSGNPPNDSSPGPQPWDSDVSHGVDTSVPWTEADEENLQRQLAAQEAARAPRRKGLRGLVITGAVLLVALIVAFGAFTNMWKLPFAPKTPEFCPIAEPAFMEARLVRVTVINAGNQQGLGRSVTDELGKRKFQTSPASNAQPGQKVPAVAEIVHGPDGIKYAKTLAAHIKGAVLVATDRKGIRVDLVIGSGWQGLVPPPEAAEATKPTPAPSPSGCIEREPSKTTSVPPAGPPADSPPPG